MSCLPEDLYAGWRRACVPWGAFREARGDGGPTERLLQQVWRHQRLVRDRLRLMDGRSLTVLHPGFWNQEPGPDFRQALLRFAKEEPFSADVEVDLVADGWLRHGHAGNPAFRGVGLHVVWEPPIRPFSPLPTLALQGLLDSSLPVLAESLSGAPPDQLPAGQEGACAEAFARLDEPRQAALLDQAAQVRLEAKAHAIEARARQAGWEAALWEALFAALGYKHNAWPMRHLAELLPRLRDGAPTDLVGWQARLLGVAGLLPRDLPRHRPGTEAWLQRAWEHWWRDQAAFADLILPSTAWRLAGLRPANHPQRRLALAAHWLHRDKLPAALERWLLDEVPERRLASSLRQLLLPETDPFWETRWNLRAAPLAEPQALLGEARVTDLAMNAILPWLWSRAGTGLNQAARRRVETRYRAWHAAQDNAVLRLARQRLVRARRLPRPGRAAHQQGLLQIVADFCQLRDACCTDCTFPMRLAALTNGAPRNSPADSPSV